MLKTVLQFTVIFSIIGFVYAFNDDQGQYTEYVNSNSNENEGYPNSVQDILILTGSEKPLHYIEKLDPDSARMGKEMVLYGSLKDGSNERISKFFVCTDCHNQQPESANPANESPEAVIQYSMENNLPYLPASTFYGMYNKEHWYNGDYDKKYGDLVVPTRDTLYNAIQLCATQCAQGRELDRWEVRAIMHYYKSLELKISDLVFTQKEMERFDHLIVTNKSKAQEMLREKYNQINPATFTTSAIPVIEGYEPSYEKGQFIYNNGCLHCHDPETGITNFTLEDTELSLSFLHRKKDKYNHYSVPHITRYGTYAIVGRRQYMPMYSLEKMSEKQLLDLLHYIKVGAGE